MANDDLHFPTLDKCCSAVKKPATRLEERGDPYPAKAAGSTAFGNRAGSSGLATILDRIESAVDGEPGRLTGRLLLVERALDEVETNIRRADKAGEV
ncbi:hypothetical protein AB0M44_32690 [Streptosporangium subroseum]|uniref:hypothetical protein n=1 Tax=Streptosporangium subroseum TaxID=106412 RepID=UPI003426F746